MSSDDYIRIANLILNIATLILVYLLISYVNHRDRKNGK